MEDFEYYTEVGGSEDSSSIPAVISLRSVEFTYQDDPFELHVPELVIAKGEQVALTGPSGCGKTTLINLFAGILTPDSGQVIIDSIEITDYNERDRADFRIASLGLIFQEFELLDYLSVLDNIILPYRINPVLCMSKDTVSRARELCERVGLGSQMHKHPGNMSQGERQRVAVCRALITEPSIILGDEPTANLDTANRDNIMDIILSYSADQQKTLVMVTHDLELVKRFDRTIDIRDFHR